MWMVRVTDDLWMHDGYLPTIILGRSPPVHEFTGRFEGQNVRYVSKLRKALSR